MRKKRPDVSTRRQGAFTVRLATGSITPSSVRAIEPTHLACVAAGFVLLFSRIEYGQSGTVLAGLWQQEEGVGAQASAGHSAATLTKNKISADATTLLMTIQA